ncbi:MAG: hypothetical protein IJR92_00885 [Alphaproteobacteria bacterium]|nr:hypothetical protein [Alphaproteobacteria bacterium]
MFDAKWFFDLEKQIYDLGIACDAQSFDEIKQNLAHPRRFSPDEFFDMCAYVILAGGFSQKTAKRIHAKIIECVHANGADFNVLIKLFNNKNKINAICSIWNNRKKFCDGFYSAQSDDERVLYLATLPHIGKITANHLARNLGIDIVKYDVWIQRLGVLYGGNMAFFDKINNGKLSPEIKKICDDMFEKLSKDTGLPRGYIDVVLWKSAQTGLIKF